MALFGAGLIFFVLTFGPRFFEVMNFRVGFIPTGFYSQWLFGLSHFDFNPFIPSLGTRALDFKMWPSFTLFLPFSFLGSHSSIFLFLDEMAVLLFAGGLCALIWRGRGSARLSFAVFVACLFNPWTLLRLQTGESQALWTLAFASWLAYESLQKRRHWALAIWGAFLALTDPSSLFYIFALGLILLFTRHKRWNLTKRLITVAPLFITLVMVLGLYFYILRTNDVWPQNLKLTTYLPLLFTLALGAVAKVILVKNPVLERIVAASIVSIPIYLSFVQNQFYNFWALENRSVTASSVEIHGILAQIPPDVSVASSEVATALLTRSELWTLKSAEVGKATPQYVFVKGEPTVFDRDKRYEQAAQNANLQTRLFRKIAPR